MQQVTLFDQFGYRIDSFSNGAAYAITRKDDGASVFIQYGDDGTAFRVQFDRCEGNPHSIADLCREYDEVMEAEAAA